MKNTYCIAFYLVGWDRDSGYVKGYSLSSKEAGERYLRSLGFKEEDDGLFIHPGVEYYAVIEREGWCDDFPVDITNLKKELNFRFINRNGSE